MIFAPKPIGAGRLDAATLKADRKQCRKIGSCGVGGQALYLGGLLFERAWYAPYADLDRVFKRVVIGSGGFTGRGLFSTMVYVVAQCKSGPERRCGFRREQEVDRLLEELGRARPDLPLVSAEAERRLAAAKAAEAALYPKSITAEAQAANRELARAQKRLEAEAPALCRRLAEAARRRRAQALMKPSGKMLVWAVLAAALALVLAGLVALALGHPSWLYLLLFGGAFALMVLATGALPVGRNTPAAALREWEEAVAAMAGYLGDDPFPLPPRYAHPVVLERMRRVLRQGRAQSAEEALAVVKEDLRALHAGVTVSPAEYEEVVTVKPMFLVCDYQ